MNYARRLRLLYRFPYALGVLTRRNFDLLRVAVASRRNKNSQLYTQLREEGYVDVSTLLDEHDLHAFRAIDEKLRGEVDEFQASKGYTRINDFHSWTELPKGTLAKLAKFSNNFFGVRSSFLEHTQYQRSWVVGEPDPPGIGFHVDDYGCLLKFFFFLTDVTPTRAPLEVIKGTGGYMGLWRGFRWLWKTDLRSTYFSEAELSHLQTSSARSLLLCRACTMFAVDTSCLHTAHKPIDGERRLIVLTFRPGLV